MSRPRFGVPPMSASRLAALARADPEAAQMGHRNLDNAGAPVVGRKGIQEYLEQLGAGQQLVAGHTTEMLALMQSGVQNEVLEVARRTIPPEGWLERRFMAPYAGISVVNASSALITVQEGAGASSAAQGDGPGTFDVPAGSAVTMPLAGRSVIFYGTPGTRFSYCVLTRRPEPSAGGSLGGTIVGGAPAGAAPAGNPVLVAGSDGAAVRTIRTDAAGDVYTTSAAPSATLAALWTAAAVGATGVSATANAYTARAWMIAGTVNAATTLTVQVSSDTLTWRTTTVAVTLAAAGDFSIDCRPLLGALYVRLQSSAAATISATWMGNY